jgi:hypothetical protein
MSMRRNEPDTVPRQTPSSRLKHIFDCHEAMFKFHLDGAKHPSSTDAKMSRGGYTFDPDAMLGIKSLRMQGRDVPLKVNSGSYKLWSTLSRDKLIYLESEIDINGKTAFETPFDDGEPGYATEGPRMFLQIDGGSNLAEPIVFTSSIELPLKEKFVIGIKLWGFAGMVSASGCFWSYKRAVNELYPDIRDRVNEATRAMKDVAIVLRFDGDPMLEKKGNKFTHAFFAPLVAQELRYKFEDDGKKAPHIALVITKIDKGPISDLVSKFMDKDGAHYRLRGKRTLEKKDADGKVIQTAQHSYPGADIIDENNSHLDRPRHFNSITIAIAMGKYEPLPALSSEVKNQFMYRNLLTSNKFKGVIADYCICIGGNTEGGATSWAEFLAPFDRVVRKTIFAEAG